MKVSEFAASEERGGGNMQARWEARLISIMVNHCLLWCLNAVTLFRSVRCRCATPREDVQIAYNNGQTSSLSCAISCLSRKVMWYSNSSRTAFRYELLDIQLTLQLMISVKRTRFYPPPANLIANTRADFMTPYFRAWAWAKPKIWHKHKHRL